MWDLARMKGVPAEVFDRKIDRLLAEFGAEFAASMPEDMSKHILPGVPDLLDALSRTGNILMLYTGDSPEVAEAALQATGFGRYFRYRFFGTQHKKREDMVALAIRQAEESSGQQFKGKAVVIIGDSLRDVDCGRIFRALVIGVATGYYSTRELVDAGADLAVRSLQESKTILDAID